MEGMLKCTGLKELYLYQEPKFTLKNKMGNFDEAGLHRAYSQAQGKDDKTVTIASRSRQIERKIQARTNIAYTPGFIISPAKYPSITPGITQEDA